MPPVRPTPCPPSRMIDILNLTYDELEAWMTDALGEPRFRARQVWQWLWQ